MTANKILAFAGSLRKDSYNKKLVKIAARGAEEGGAEVTYIDLKDFPLPLYDQEIEEVGALPDNALKLKELMWEHRGFLIASPEYNGLMSGALKNMIDWTSRPASSDEKNLSCFTGKTAAVMSASPGALGGMRGVLHLRILLENIGVLLLPQQQAIAKAMDAFDQNGELVDKKKESAVKGLGKELAGLLSQLKR